MERPVYSERSEPNATRMKEVIGRFEPNNKSLIIPILQALQETFGYVPPESLKLVSKHTNVSQNKIYGVLTFYAQFTTTPRGKYIVRPCRGTACHVRGANKVINHIKNFLNIEDGQTTSNYRFSLETVACLGTCFLAPAMMVNHDYYGNMDEKKTEEVLKSYD
ncbi:MAG: NAD(P)H-dependent oxidoreductase subunit E [Planctomycetota bacterium]|nr:NAD(P)H-dependent oxidoreductase subunit E [Planctomycetota bacterium]MDI6787814.1 NAD(P)H-dependent oxidoreductase subunit E [Planctomycetota bacterium]